MVRVWGVKPPFPDSMDTVNDQDPLGEKVHPKQHFVIHVRGEQSSLLEGFTRNALENQDDGGYPLGILRLAARASGSDGNNVDDRQAKLGHDVQPKRRVRASCIDYGSDLPPRHLAQVRPTRPRLRDPDVLIESAPLDLAADCDKVRKCAPPTI